ncbi:MAG: RNA polymerase sigma factor [Candidatus Doudnabacteria bacterium]
MTEEELKNWLQKAQSGDQDAFGRIYDHFADKIYRFIYFRVGHKEVAEDVLSDTFVKSWEKINQINSPGALSGWLYQIAKNNIIDYYRLKKELIALSEVEEFLVDEASSVDSVNLSFQQNKILNVLNQLPQDQQQIIKYRFFEDLSNEEISYIMGKTEGSVRVLQHRAIAKLKELLKNKQ